MAILVIAVIGISFAASIIFLIRRDKLHVKHGLGWMLLALSLVLSGFAPAIIDWVGSHLDIAYPPIFAIVVTLAGVGIKLLLIDIEQSRIELRHHRMVQRLAILEAELLDIKHEREKLIDSDDQDGGSK